MASYSNYILGNDPSRWLSRIPNFGRVTYESIYPGVDVAFYGNRERLEHDFVVAPGADYHVIRVRLNGLRDLELQADGNLKLSLPDGDLSFGKPEVYQLRAGKKEFLRGRYVLLSKNEFGFEVTDYDRSRSLVIDPILTYSTYLANLSVVVSGVATDAEGDTFVTGLTFYSSFPVTSGAYQASCNSCPSAPEVYIAKVNASGTGLVYSTYLGGSSYNQPFGIAVDNNGNAVVTGSTQSTDFPVKNPVMTVNTGPASQYAFITSLSADGTSLNYSSVMGGAAEAGGYSVSNVGGVAVDVNGNAYISGTTNSPAFPVTALNLVTPAAGNNVVFVSKFLPTGSLGYSALLGDVTPQNPGAGPNGVMELAVDGLGSAYIAGVGGSLWPTTTGAYQTAIPGTAPYAAPFVAKLAPDASSLTYSTFLGDGGFPTAITVNSAGEAFVTGDYAPGDFPTTANAYQKTLGSGVCCVAFLTEFNAAGSQLLYSSYFGGSLTASQGTKSTTGIALDGNGNIWLSGYTTDPLFPLQYPLQSLPASSNGFPTFTGFISELNSTETQLTFSSYLGGVQSGMLAGVAIDTNNNVHVAGTTASDLFTTPGAYLSTVTPPPPNVDYTYGYVTVIDPSVGAPAVCFTPQPLSFGNVLVGTSLNLTFTVTNCGSVPLTVGAITSNNSTFSVPSNLNGCQQAVAANATCSFAVTFTPTTVGQTSCTLTINSNAPISMTSLSLTGQGAVPQIQVQNTSVTFDPQFVGQTSSNQSVGISNIGGVPLHVNLSQTTVTAGFAYSQYGCNQPIDQEGSCLLQLTFTPTAAGVLTGQLSIASDDPVTPTVLVALSGTGYSSYPVSTLTTVNPPTLPVGNASVLLQVSGSNFFPASIVYAGGAALSTNYQNSTALTATLNASQLTSLGEIPVTVFNPAPGGGESTSFTLTTYESIPLAATALVYNSVTRFLYAAIEAAATNNPNTVAVVDPVAGTVTQYIAVGNDPRALGLSSDGQYLYVALNGDHTIQRINLSTLAVDQTFALPVDPSFGLLTAGELKVVPGSLLLVVVSLFREASPSEDGIALYDNGTPVNWLPDNGVTASVAVDSFDFAGTPPLVYSLPSAIGTSGPFAVFTIGSSGIQVQSTGTSNAPPPIVGSALVSDGALLYTNSGQIWNPSPQTLVGTYNPALLDAAGVVPDDSDGRTYFLDTEAMFSQYEATSVDAYDQNSLALIGTVPFLPPLVYGPDAIALTRWGTNGFAFVVGDFVPTTGSGQLILFRSSISGTTIGQNPVPVLASLGASSATSGGPSFTLSVTGSNFVSGSVIQWNGTARATTFVSGTQLTAGIMAADIAQPGTALVDVSTPSPGGGISSPLSFTIIPSPPAASLNPTSLTFGSQVVGSASAAQTLMLTNAGALPLAINGVQITGDFTQTNNCPASLASLASCTISVTFTPSASGTRQASLAITDNAANSPQTVVLSGTGAPDFSFGTGSSNTTAATVLAGQAATYSLSLVSGTSSSGTVTLSCTHVPANAQCTISPSSLSLASGQSANFTVTVNTGTSAVSLAARLHVLWAVCGFGWLLTFPLFRRRRRSNLFASALFSRQIPLVLGFLLIATEVAGCGGGSYSPPPTPATTPPGTYTLQIVATEGTVTHSQSITLIVQ